MQKFSSAKEVKDHKEAVYDQSSYPFSCPVCNKLIETVMSEPTLVIVPTNVNIVG